MLKTSLFVLVSFVQRGPLTFNKVDYAIGWLYREVMTIFFFFEGAFSQTVTWRTGTYRLRWGGFLEECWRHNDSFNIHIIKISTLSWPVLVKGTYRLRWGGFLEECWRHNDSFNIHIIKISTLSWPMLVTETYIHCSRTASAKNADGIMTKISTLSWPML